MRLYPFWTTDKRLSHEDDTIAEACLGAHTRSAVRGNISCEVLKAAAVGSGQLTTSVIAALATLGGKHAPIAETHDVLLDATIAPRLLASGQLVPGWGNSFVKGGPDVLWDEVDALLAVYYPDIKARINDVSRLLHDHGRNVYPNPSCYTAAVGWALKMPRELIPLLFILGRMQAWAAIYTDATL